MENQSVNFGLQILAGLLGGLFGGGLIVGWIEFKRYSREKKEWARADKKVELIKLTTQSLITNWDTKYANDTEKIRLFESGLNGKIRYWRFLIKYEIANLTGQDILAHSISPEIPQPKMIKPFKEDKKYFNGYKRQSLKRYNLLSKEITDDSDFPIIIPAHSKIGMVFFGDNEFDYPNLVEEVARTGLIKIVFDGNVTLTDEFSFDEEESDFYLAELDYVKGTDELHWVPYLEKKGIEHGIPF